MSREEQQFFQRISSRGPGVPLCAALGILPTMHSGLSSGFNPGTIAVFVFFATYLGMVLSCRGRRIWPSLIFVFGFAGSKVVADLGFLDGFILRKIVDQAWDVFYLVLGSLAALIAFGWLRDWWVFKKSQDLQRLWFKAVPQDAVNAVPCGSGWQKFFRNFLTAWLAALGGFVVAVMVSAWPPDSYVQILVTQLPMPGQETRALVYCFFYGAMLSFPFWLSLFLVRVLRDFPQVRKALRQFLSVVQISCAAVFLAVGGFLFSYFWN